MTRLEVPRQGELDGLCGIYALTAYLREVRDDYGLVYPGPKQARADDAFWVLLDAAERLNMFNVDYFLNGYPSHHLVKIWNEVADCLAVQRVAYTLTKIAQLGRHGSFYEVSKIVVQDDNTATALFVLLDGHWFISTSVTESGSFELKDSSPEKRGPVTISRRRFEQDVRDGFVILPARSSILQSAKQEL